MINCAASSSIEEFQSIMPTSSITSLVEFSSVASSVSRTLDFLSIPAVTSTSSSESYSSISPSATATVYGPPTEQSDSLSLVAVKTVSSLTPTSATVGVPGASNEQSSLQSWIAATVVSVVLLLAVAVIVLVLVVLRRKKSLIKIQVSSNKMDVSNPCYLWGKFTIC